MCGVTAEVHNVSKPRSQLSSDFIFGNFRISCNKCMLSSRYEILELNENVGETGRSPMKFKLLSLAAAATLVAVSPASATTKVFNYSAGGTSVASGSFSYADGSAGILGYGDLTAFSVTAAGTSYSLADVTGLTDYIHFAYDTVANTFVVDPNSCGFDGCGFDSSLSAINSNGTAGFFFTSVPGGFTEYSTGTSEGFDTLSIGAAVPEPAVWGLMILGFSAVGAAMRANRKVAVSYA
jgi:hypothetical protein